MNPKATLGMRATLLLATGFGLGYLPIAPATWGSIGSLGVYALIRWWWFRSGISYTSRLSEHMPASFLFLTIHSLLVILISLVGVWAAQKAARQFEDPDPRRVVIDEISGQQIALLSLTPLDWKHAFAGFLLFRAFDIWKPFPARQAEAWPGGWGIMADDWFAALYVVLVLALARLWGL